MSQATNSIISDSGLSGIQSDASSFKEPPLIDLEDVNVKVYEKIRNSNVRKAYKTVDIVKITPESESILKMELC